MTEKEKMLAGILYDANNDKNLFKERMLCKDICFEYNNVKLKEAMREYYEMFPEDIVNVNRFFYNMLQTPSFLARDFEMCKRCINVGGITYDNAVKLNRMVCMLFEGYFKDVYENGIEEEQIPERVKLMVDDVDTIVMALANNLKGYKGYRK